MSKDSLVFGLGGMVIGLIVGAFVAGQTPQRIRTSNAPMQQSATQPAEQSPLPEGHPQIEQSTLASISEQQEVLQRDPENQSAIVALANLNFDLNNHKEAIKWYEKALVPRLDRLSYIPTT